MAVRLRLCQLRHLDVAACYKITDAGVANLIALPELRVLDLRQCRALTPGCIDLLAKAQQVEDLDLRHIEWVTAAQVQKLRAAMVSLRVLRTNVEDEAAAVQRRLEQVSLEHSFASATVKDWSTYYANLVGLTFMVTPEVRDMDPAKTTLTAFKLPRMSVAQALKVIQAQTGVTWRVQDGMVVLVPQAAK
jgi:hypothetical protein